LGKCINDWSADEFSTLNLGDTRLNRRAEKLLNAMYVSPYSSLPEACCGWADTNAAYRFFMNDAVSAPALLEAHSDSTVQRIKRSDSSVILCIQDTTELNFNGQQIEGLGRLSYDAQRGMYLHPTLCVTPERIALGITDAWMWARGKTKKSDKKTPSVKESIRWTEGYERVAEMAETVPNSRLVYVADREGDLTALMQRAEQLEHPADWLIRAKHNRSLGNKEKLWDKVTEQSPIASIRFTKSRRKGEKAREVCQEIKVLTCCLHTSSKTPTTVTLVEAREIDPPAGKVPLVWRLLTNRAVESAEKAIELLGWYRCRWEIEMFFDVLKVGCEVEKLQLNHRDRIEKALALYMIVAWRVMNLMRLGRECPELPASLVFDTLEWKAAYGLNNQPLPDTPPTLNEMVRQLAMLGGFLARKSDGEPGAKSIWRGLQRLQDCLYGVHLSERIKDLL
jgi:hypothetical protein